MFAVETASVLTVSRNPEHDDAATRDERRRIDTFIFFISIFLYTSDV